MPAGHKIPEKIWSGGPSDVGYVSYPVNSNHAEYPPHDARVHVPMAPLVTINDIVNGAIAAIDNGRRRTKGASTERLRLVAFAREFPAICKTALVDATEEMFEDWMAERLDQVKPNTVLRELRLLKPLLAAAARKHNLRRSPLEYISPPPMIDERVRRLAPEEEALLFAELARASDLQVHHAARFALETGCRRSEQLRIQWSDFDARAGTIWLADAKNGRGRYILLTEEAQRLVEALPGRAGGGNIFKLSSNQLRKAFEYARSRAARKADRMGHPELASVKNIHWHDLRHEAISRCFDEGWTSEQVMDFSGHVDIKSLLRYRHPKVDQSVARLRDLASKRLSSKTLLGSI
jgi:integrase